MADNTELQELQDRAKRAWFKLHDSEMSENTMRRRLPNKDACLAFLRYYSKIHKIKC